jgi:hypothetical protein
LVYAQDGPGKGRCVAPADQLEGVSEPSSRGTNCPFLCAYNMSAVKATAQGRESQ